MQCASDGNLVFFYKLHKYFTEKRVKLDLQKVTK